MAQISIDQAAAQRGVPRETLEAWAKQGLLILRACQHSSKLPQGSQDSEAKEKLVDEDELDRLVESLGWLHLSGHGWEGPEEGSVMPAKGSARSPLKQEVELRQDPESHSIPPFPDDIDRNRFADWLSGFTDGEGCFCLSATAQDGRPIHVARFQIGLRADEHPILQIIQSFFGCGTMFVGRQRGSKSQNPIRRFRITKVGDLVRVVIPYFERYPLKTKQKNDFKIWREAVELLADVQKRKRHAKGIERMWTQEERSRFLQLKDLLRRQRSFGSPILELP